MGKLILKGGVSAPLTNYVDDVFSAYTYVGNGGTQTITNGMDLAGKGGLVWLKMRGSPPQSHELIDTARGSNKWLQSDTLNAQSTLATIITAFNSNGFSLGAGDFAQAASTTGASWTFIKKARFFDIVTYTGNGGTQTLSHALGQSPGMVIIKRTDAASTDGWYVWHRGTAAGNYLLLNATAAQAATVAATKFGNNTITVDPTSTQFTVGSYTDLNVSAGTFVAYLFAHDAAADGIIQCGAYTNNTTVTLGWEPQFILTRFSTVGDNWNIFDSSRGFVADVATVNPRLVADATSAEGTLARVAPTATGFVTTGSGATTGIYIAIRRSNKPPTLGTQVYNAVARTGTSAAATVSGVGFAPDLIFHHARNFSGGGIFVDRLRGISPVLQATSIAAEFSSSDILTAFIPDGVTLGVDAGNYMNVSGTNYINWFLKRAPGVFEQVIYSGNGGTLNVSHNLGVIPELMIVKNRGNGNYWAGYHKDLGNTYSISLNQNIAKDNATSRWGNTTPTASVFTVTSINETNGIFIYVAYLFASLAGISKVGSYTGNGSSQTINCAFTTGARFIMIKRADAVGDWFVWDTVRGIIAANDPHVSLNTATAEVGTDDSVDPDTSGFIVNQVAGIDVNVTASTYIFLAFA